VEHPGFTLIEDDLTTVSLIDIVRQVDGVYHLAAQPGVRGSWGSEFDVYVRDNIVASQRVFEATSRTGNRVVFASSSSIYGNAEHYPTPEITPPLPVSPYGVTKHMVERLAYAYASQNALDYIALRYFTVYGPRQRPDMAFTRLAIALMTGAVFRVYGTGTQTRDVTYVDDAVAATMLAMASASPARVFNVGGGSEISLLDAIQLFGETVGEVPRLAHDRPAMGDVTRTAADISLIRNELGWTPKTAINQGIARQLAWVQEMLDSSIPLG
jgi:nucleoside-diphosphate-sugar epimerase